ncbi:MAG: helix-turn-helix domain-containing protein [Rhodoferax sp.]
MSDLQNVSEVLTSAPLPADAPAVAEVRAGAASAGAMLRSAREAMGLHVAALAVSLKVPVKKLEALEADQFDALPDAVFVRALAASVCRALRIDPAPVLERLPQGLAPRLEPEQRGINAPFRGSGRTPLASLPELLTRPMSLVVLALLLLALAIAVFPETRATLRRSNSAPETAAQPDPGIAMSGPASGASAALNQIDVKPPQPVAIASPNAPANEGNAMAGPVVASGGAALLTFRAKGASWVKVTDPLGAVRLHKTLSAGEVVSVSGDGPVAVVVGRADLTDVEVRGQAFNLTDYARENVARFEVK